MSNSEVGKFSIHDIYRKMIEAANKAKENWTEYGARETYLIEQLKYTQVQLELDPLLKQFGRRYSTWKGEQERLKNLLEGHLIYIQLDIMSKTFQREA